MDGPRNVSVQGEDVQFWVVQADPLLKETALVAKSNGDGQVLQEPAEHETVAEYSESELAKLREERASSDASWALVTTDETHSTAPKIG